MPPLPLASAPTLTPDELQYVVRSQAGVVSREQLVRAGLGPSHGRSKVSSGRWRRLYPGVCLTNTGVLTFTARCWAAVLVCGEGAVVAGAAAARLNRTSSAEVDVIEVKVPGPRHIRTWPGVRVSRRVGLPDDGQRPPRTSIAATALDLAAAAGTADAVVGHIADAARQMRSLEPLRAERATRSRLRHSALIDDVLAPASEGSSRHWSTGSIVGCSGRTGFRRFGGRCARWSVAC